MTINPFLQCLVATGISTGSAILGLYDFSSGDGLVVFNQLYATGFHYISGIPYNDALPMIFNGSGNQPSGKMNGTEFYQISDIFTSDFSTVIYLNYSGCNYTGNKNQLLCATSLTSGAFLGITPSNRLFIQTPDYSYTIPREIGVGDFAYFSVLGGRFTNFGLFSVTDNVLYAKGYDEVSSIINVTDLTYGGALSYQSPFTGYAGKINEIYLFSGALNVSSVNGCVGCAFVTGYTSSSNSVNYLSTQITGSYWSGLSGIGTTSITQVLSSYPKLTGGTGYVYFDSGISGSVSVGKALIPLSQTITGTEYFSGISFSFNSAQATSGMLFDFYFPQGLFSGDIVEIYTYLPFNTGVGFQLSSFQYPHGNVVQLYGNGLAETIGVDYAVAFNNLLIGFDSQDILQYDIYPITYTGPYATGFIQTGTTGSSFVNITGVSGMSLSGFASDIYLNGQKMASGLNYSVSGSTLTVSGNDLQDFNDFSDTVEIKFIPQYGGLIRSFIEISGNQSYISGISGFSEQVWVNGMRQFKCLDYFKYPRCRACTGNFVNPGFPFTLYNSATDNIGFFH